MMKIKTVEDMLEVLDRLLEIDAEMEELDNERQKLRDAIVNHKLDLGE